MPCTLVVTELRIPGSSIGKRAWQGDNGGVDPEVEVLDVGPSNDPRRVRRRRALALLIAAAIVAGVVTALVHNGHRAPAAAEHSPTPTPTIVPTTEPPRPPPPPAVTVLGHPLLHETVRFDLFGRGDGVVERVQLSRGRITRTTVPTLQSTGPVEFVPAAGRVIIRPIDSVRGYVIKDGRQAAAIREPGGLILPGPDLDHQWMALRGGMTLMTSSGRPTHTVIPYPRGAGPLDAIPDGGGYVLFPNSGGVYVGRPNRTHRISTGSLLAVGPRGWLVSEDCAHRCTSVLIDRSTGKRHVLGPTPSGGRGPAGVISPDGATAAMIAIGRLGHSWLYLLDLSSGAQRRVPMNIGQAIGNGTAVWSPDGRWLFAIGSRGQVRVVDPRTLQVRPLGVALPPLTQLAVRPDPAG